MNNPIQSTSPPLPGDPTGNQLCQIFGRQPWDFILSNAPKLPQGKPAWRTVTDYPLRPRVLWEHWQDPNQLIGVRFDDQTHYGLIDIDAGSPYCTPEAIADIKAALETIGITRTLLLRSSWSNGLHLYIPLPEPVKTFDLAVTLQSCLTAQDLQIAKGTLEIFPNPKPYRSEEHTSELQSLTNLVCRLLLEKKKKKKKKTTKKKKKNKIKKQRQYQKNQ